MIVFLVTGEHEYALQRVRTEIPDLEVEVLPYEQALSLERLPAATYVFADVDRLSTRDQLDAARLYRQLSGPDGGCRVLNDPARVRSRFGLLRALYRQGLNAFNAYRADEAAAPERYPVFVRYEREHDAPLTDLLPDQGALRAALAEAVGRGLPEHALLVVEFCARPLAGRLYQRHAAYRVGDRVFAAEMVIEDHWCVKRGRAGLARPEDFARELREVRDFTCRDHLMRAFEIGGVEYGRADYGLVDGRAQVYEINTNPVVGRLAEHWSPEREESQRLIRANLVDALRAIDTPDPG